MRETYLEMVLKRAYSIVFMCLSRSKGKYFCEAALITFGHHLYSTWHMAYTKQVYI